MKTKNTKSIEGLPDNTANRVTAQPEQAATPKQDTRLPIDTKARQANRTLPTSKVLEMLKQANPGLFNLAEVVGKWVWVQFPECPCGS